MGFDGKAVYNDETDFYETESVLPSVSDHYRTFLIPYLSLFSWAYRKAEIIIRTKAQSLEKKT